MFENERKQIVLPVQDKVLTLLRLISDCVPSGTNSVHEKKYVFPCFDARTGRVQ